MLQLTLFYKNEPSIDINTNFNNIISRNQHFIITVAAKGHWYLFDFGNGFAMGVITYPC